MKMRLFGLCTIMAVVGVAVTSAEAAITPGNLVVYRVGDGSAALGTTATKVFLDEYTPTGTLVQSIPISSSGASAMTAVGNSTTEGVISRSQDGTNLVFTGYRKDAGLPQPSSDNAATTNRVIGTVDLTGAPSTSIAINSGPSSNIRSATTVAGASYYVSAAATNFVSYVAAPGPACSSTAIDARNSRQVNLFDNELIVSNGSTSITGKIQSYGILPTGVTAATPVISLLTTDAVHGFSVLDLNPAVPGKDTIYGLSTVEAKLYKWIYDGTSWTAAGTIATTAANICTAVDGSNVNLYLTTGSTLLGITDASGATGTLTGTLTTLATAGTNTGFRGIGTLIPEPATLALVVIGGGLVLRRRR